jgi:hypothetical protein
MIATDEFLAGIKLRQDIADQKLVTVEGNVAHTIAENSYSVIIFPMSQERKNKLTKVFF